MSHAHDHDPTVPRGALVAAAILLLFTMALTGAVTSGLIPQSGDPDASRAAQHIMPAQERDLRFTDREDGAVVVTDAATGATVMEIGFGEGGFVRDDAADGEGSRSRRYWIRAAVQTHPVGKRRLVAQRSTDRKGSRNSRLWPRP